MRAIQQNNVFHAWTPSKRQREFTTARPYTLILDLPDYSFWKETIQQTDPVDLFNLEVDIQVGLSVVNPTDQFSRKEGLRVALSKLMPVKAKLAGVTILKSGDLLLSLSLGQYPHSLSVTVGHRSGRALISNAVDSSHLHLLLYGR